MRVLVLVLALLLFSEFASSQTIYKCQVNGRTEYSGSPCHSGKEVKRMAPDGGPTPEDRARARMRFQAQLAEQRQVQASGRSADLQNPGVVDLNATRRTVGRSSDSTVSARDNEKVLTHDISGWDRKPRGQVQAEQEARATAAAPPPTGAAWESRRSTTHSISGWDTKSGREQVLDVAQREREQREIAARTIASCDSSGCTTISGTRYNMIGRDLVIGPSGSACTVAGNRLVC